MNKKLFFLCFATGVIVLSIVCITIAPIINKVLSFGEQNCKLAQVNYEYYKSRDYAFEEKADKLKKEVSLCKKRNAMHDLEYTAFIIDIVLGFICSLLGLILFLEAGKNIEKYSGLIGLISGIIITIFTIVYVGFSADIFTNDIAYKTPPLEIFNNMQTWHNAHPNPTDHNYDPLTPSTLTSSPITILYPNQADKHWNGEKYIFDYDENEEKKDYEIKYIKYKDLGKKQYNYDSEIAKISDSVLHYCNPGALTNSFSEENAQHKIVYPVGTPQKECDYVWSSENPNQSIDNKFLYDRWLTNIILSIILSLFALGMSIFGFLLFKNSSDSTSSPDLIPNSNNN